MGKHEILNLIVVSILQISSAYKFFMNETLIHYCHSKVFNSDTLSKDLLAIGRL
jgi:hypothetical protein